jgi:hypothetical protein
MYYVYVLINPITNSPFYVGKGKDDRASIHTIANKKGRHTENPYKDNVIKQILSEGKEPVIEYVFWSESEEEAYAHEEQLIRSYGRKMYDGGILTNLCLGNNPPHNPWTEERRAHHRQLMLGNQINKGRALSSDEKAKRSQSLKKAYETGRRTITDEQRLIISETHKGKKITDQTKKNMSISAKKGHAHWVGKTNEEIFGTEKAAEIRNKKLGVLPSNSIPINIDGVSYPSIKHAATALGISEYKVKKYYVSK